MVVLLWVTLCRALSEPSHAAQAVQLTPLQSPPPALEMSLSKQTSTLIVELSVLHALRPSPSTCICDFKPIFHVHVCHKEVAVM